MLRNLSSSCFTSKVFTDIKLKDIKEHKIKFNNFQQALGELIRKRKRLLVNPKHKLLFQPLQTRVALHKNKPNSNAPEMNAQQMISKAKKPESKADENPIRFFNYSSHRKTIFVMIFKTSSSSQTIRSRFSE